MTTLDPKNDYLTVINMFSVDPSKADDLLQALMDETEHRISKAPGFVSANFHVSKDRKYVTNYAQWRGQADLDAMMADAEGNQYFKRVRELADKVSPVFYDLRASYGPAS